MPSVTYMNNSAPFWDFVAGLEQQGTQHPFFAQNRNDVTDNDREAPHQGAQDPFAPFRWSQFFGGERRMPHRGGPGHRPEGANGEPDQERNEQTEAEKDGRMNTENDNGEGPSGNSGSDNDAHNGGRSYGRCGGGRRGRCGPGGLGASPRHGPHHRGHREGWGPWVRGGPFGGMGGGPFGVGDSSNSFDPSTFVTQLFNQFNDSHPTNATKPTEAEDYIPDADIFDTESAYVVHVSLPGAKKEDVGVNWEAEKSELSVAGVIYRPGDEEFLKTLALNERKVGAFERKIRLGTRANPANVDADGITAKLEDGVLRVEVPKLDSGYVEIRKVDIE
jgi:HSP20 family protein